MIFQTLNLKCRRINMKKAEQLTKIKEINKDLTKLVDTLDKENEELKKELLKKEILLQQLKSEK